MNQRSLLRMPSPAVPALLAALSLAGTAQATQMQFASMSIASVRTSNGSVLTIGQPMAGVSTGSGYRMTVGAIEGLVPIRPADFNADRRVDPDDWALMAGCIAGPDGKLSAPCDRTDLSNDMRTDLRDVSTFQRQMTSGSR